MTIIAYRDGVMAADSKGSRNGAWAGYSIKIVKRAHDGALCGADGNANLAAAFRRWFLAGENPDSRPKLSGDDNANAGALIVRPDGSMEEHDANGWHATSGPFYAIGSGSPEALGAMAAGADARRAVEIAIELDNDCGGKIDVLRLGVQP